MKTQEQMAVHEAGRAIAACALNREFESVSIAPGAEGRRRPSVVLVLPPDKAAQQHWLQDAAIIGLAGAAAEALNTNHGGLTAQVIAEDYPLILATVEQLLSISPANKLRDVVVLTLWEQTLALLVKHWGSVRVLADMLMDLGTLSWNEAHEILEHTTQWRY